MTSVSGTHSNEHLTCSNFTVAEHNISILIFFKEGLFYFFYGTLYQVM